MKETWALIDKFPPYLVRCLARRRVGTKQIQAISDQDIAIMSQIPLQRVVDIYNSPTWDAATVSEMKRFCSACDFDPENSVDRNRLSAYKNQRGGPKFTYLRKSPWWDSTFKPLILKFFNERPREKDARNQGSPQGYDPGRDTGRQTQSVEGTQTLAAGG